MISRGLIFANEYYVDFSRTLIFANHRQETIKCYIYVICLIFTNFVFVKFSRGFIFANDDYCHFSRGLNFAKMAKNGEN